MNMDNINLNNLTKDNVQYLLHSLKYPSKVFEVQDIKNKLLALQVNRYKKDTVIIGVVDNIQYILHVYIPKYKSIDERYSIHLRFADTYEQLIRVDIGSGHHNPERYPDCSNVDHIHIYDPDRVPHDMIAFPLKDYDFPNINNIVEAFDSFLEYTNIKLKEGGEHGCP